MDQIIHGKHGITLIAETYAPSRIVGPPEPPEKTEAERAAERKADRIGYKAVLRKFNWTDADLVLAQDRYGFPKSIGRSIPYGGVWGVGESQYSKSAIERWRAEVLQFADSLR